MGAKAISIPTSQDLKQAVEKNIDRIRGLNGGALEGISVLEPRQQNTHSSRIGTEIVLHLNDGSPTRKVIWAKRVRRPVAAYTKMRAAYERAQGAGLAVPIPEPYFFDLQWKLIFMKKVEGRVLRRLASRYGVAFNRGRSDDVAQSFHGIGHWLAHYHHALATGSSTGMEHLADSLARRLQHSSTFKKAEGKKIRSRLERIQHGPIGARSLPLTWPHSDFTLRNILLNGSNEFFVIDWDAMVHPDFAEEASGWWDVTLFLLNLQSLIRFSPVISPVRIKALSKAFLSGYFDAARETGAALEWADVDALMYVFALRYWFGIGADRDLPAVYRRNLGWRYVRILRQRLVAGTASAFEV